MSLVLPLVCAKTDERLRFLTLRAFRHPNRKWGITPLGWETYITHWSPKVRAAARAHPQCPLYIRLRRDDPDKYTPRPPD